MSDFEKVIKKAVDDEAFQKKLSSDPAGALKDAGVEPTPEKIQAIQSAKEALRQAHAKFGGAAKPE
jgi:hypothetical protein